MVQNSGRALEEKIRLPDAAMREILLFLDRANISRLNLLNMQMASLLQSRRFAIKPLRPFRSLVLEPFGEAHGYWATLMVGDNEGMGFECDAELSELDDCLWPGWVRFKNIYIGFAGWKCIPLLDRYCHIFRNANILTLDFTKASELARYEQVVKMLKGSGVRRIELVFGDYMPPRLQDTLLDATFFYECHELNISAGYRWSDARLGVGEGVLVDWLHHDAGVQRRLHITARDMSQDRLERLVQLLANGLDSATSPRTYLLELQNVSREEDTLRMFNGRTGEELRVRNLGRLNSVLLTRSKLKGAE